MYVVVVDIGIVGVGVVLIVVEVGVSIVALVKWCVVLLLFYVLGVGFRVEREHLW